MSEKLFGKYKIEKTDGSPVDPKADYFVLRIDTDPHARKALLAYARSVGGMFRTELEMMAYCHMSVFEQQEQDLVHENNKTQEHETQNLLQHSNRGV